MTLLRTCAPGRTPDLSSPPPADGLPDTLGSSRGESEHERAWDLPEQGTVVLAPASLSYQAPGEPGEYYCGENRALRSRTTMVSAIRSCTVRLFGWMKN